MRYIKLFEEFETSLDSYYIVLKTPIEDWEKSGTIDNIEELKGSRIYSIGGKLITSFKDESSQIDEGKFKLKGEALSYAERLQENDPTYVYLIFDEKGKGLMNTKVKLGLLSRLALGFSKGYKRG